MYIPNLDRSKLLERLKYSMTKKEVLQLAQSFFESGIDPEDILSLSNNENQAVGFHSAWVLENMLLPFPEALDYYLPKIIEKIPTSQNASVQRHLTKMASHGIQRIVKRKTSRILEKEFWKTDLEPLEECCFKWLVDEETKPAVKAHCMDILFLLSKHQRWIADELPYIIDNQVSLGSPGLRARGKEIIKQLKLGH